jgi:hypothetical protein
LTFLCFLLPLLVAVKQWVFGIVMLMNSEIVEKIKMYKQQGFDDEYIKSQLSTAYSAADLEQVLHALRYMQTSPSPNQVVQNVQTGLDTTSLNGVKEVRVPWVELAIVGFAAPTVLAFLAIGAFLAILPIAGAILGSSLLFFTIFIPFLSGLITLLPLIVLGIGAWTLFHLLYKKRYSIPAARWTSLNTVLLMIAAILFVAAGRFSFVVSEILVSIAGALIVVGSVKISYLEKNTLKTVVYSFVSIGTLAAIIIGFNLFTDLDAIHSLN